MFAAYAQDPVVTRYLAWRPHTDISEAHEAVARFLAGWEAQSEFYWFIFSRETDELVGAITARRKDDGFDLGFVLARAHWGQGFMPEAIPAVTEWAFSQPWVSRVSAVCDVENPSSARALEKAGFQPEGLLKALGVHPNVSSLPRDCYSYARTRPA
jgi:RimJ/RimL family protein N-acetyltransferase